MAYKLNLITELYGETLTNIQNDPSEWMNFLECAAMNYKYPFNDQVLIYAQKPNAIACARIDDWNKKVGRWVNRGAKGIALLTEENGYSSLRYVFDVADTNSKLGKSFRLWQVSPPYEKDIIESLENKYGELENNTNLVETIKSVAKIIAEDNIQDYIDDLVFYKDNSFLENVDNEDLKVLFQKVLTNNIAFGMIKRCGLNPRDYFSEDDFKDISKFDSYDAITRVGVASSEITEMGLSEIYSTIKKLRINEINKIRTFERDKNLDYYESKERSSDNYGDNLQNARGLSNTKPSIGGETRESSGQIRNNEIELSKGEQESTLYNTSNERQINRPFDGNREIIRDENRGDSVISTREESNKREVESSRPNEMGGANEYGQESSRGDSSTGTNLRIENLPTLEEQLNTIEEAEIDNISASSFTQEMIDRTLQQGSGFEEGKYRIYRHFQQGNYQGTPPTLQDFREELLKQSEPEAKEIALAIELFTNGSLNTFAKETNVDTENRLIAYDILDLGKQLLPIGMLVVLDSILNRITRNRSKGRNTFIFIDEIYLLFQHEYSANFLFTLWKRVRKYGAYATGITQNVDDLLQSHTARTMLANSEFIVMLNQASTDRIELAKLLNISDLQMSYITNVGAGQGLLKVGSSLVPFVNKFPTNTKLYKLMTTKPGEDK